MKKHNENTNTKLIMKVLLTRGRWIKNQYLSFFFKHFMKNSSMSLVSKSTPKGIPRRLKDFVLQSTSIEFVNPTKFGLPLGATKCNILFLVEF
jgi:hypothetical protein